MTREEEFYAKLAEHVAAVIPLAEQFLDIVAKDFLEGKFVNDLPSKDLTKVCFRSNNRCANVYSFEKVAKVLGISEVPVELEHLLCEGQNIYRFNIQALGDDKGNRFFAVSRPPIGFIKHYLDKFNTTKFIFHNEIF